MGQVTPPFRWDYCTAAEVHKGVRHQANARKKTRRWYMLHMRLSAAPPPPPERTVHGGALHGGRGAGAQSRQ